ncbi:hypothetical protein R75461_01120 [Paraburkholderia nemoris]|uniref:hypothetical protein n=1 Tax=Paraburkholderia nemoris TaxID=2793076 RepID=UPI001B238663|nr:hypothetical protein [Paraburkholderia nemoris]CAE6712440.1 hypothetical protein R75461_01120 [Paraburkholderia nemoris]
MNQISPYATGAATFTATQLEPLVSWAITGFKAPMPVSVPGVIASLLVMAAHAIGNLIGARLSKSPEVPKP